ncbi:MAG TPA: serine hydroxymethyltransferase [Streptosporangiaceae bacterium]|jgi:glycine hydroxymethyltransferase
MTTAEFFTQDLATADPDLHNHITVEESRQNEQLELIAPKNYMSRAVREAHGSILAFTSVEGYPGRRWLAGAVNLDAIERLAIKRACAMFGCSYSNVQPHSGTQANQSVFFALLEPGDRVLSMALAAGGHLSHGLKTNFSGRWFDVAHYGVHPDDGLIDYGELLDQARSFRPKLLICGGSAYPRIIDFERLREIADEVGAWLLADVAHIAGLIAGGAYPNPFPHCHVVTATTNKNLRGPRGGLVLSADAELARRIDRAVFPGVQGGPLPEYTAAKAAAFGEALKPGFKVWAHSVLRNAQALAATLTHRGYAVVTGGTDTPLVLLDLRPRGLTGDVASSALESAGIPCNKNLIPGDSQKPMVTSGLRFGTSALTTRGLRTPDFEKLAHLVADVLDQLPHIEQQTMLQVRAAVAEIAKANPLYEVPSASCPDR